MSIHRKLRAVFAIGVLCAGALGAVQAQQWPTKPVRILHAGAAGGGTDVLTRVVADGLAKNTGGNFFVEAKPGAGTTIAAAELARSRPDGYTFLYTAVATWAVTPWVYKSLPYDITKDLVPIARLTTQANVFVINNDIPAKSMQEFIAYAKANKGKVNIGSIGQGTTSHLVGHAVSQSTDMGLVNVPFKGTPDLTMALMQGHIQSAAQDIAGLMPHIKSGSMRPLAVTGPKRMKDLPNVPTMLELGLKDADLHIWYVMGAPAGTPQDILEKMAKALEQTAQQPELLKRFGDIGAEVEFLPMPQARDFVRSELARYKTIVQSANVQVD